MASASTPDPQEKSSDIPKSRFQRTVCLSDWWLVRAENDVEGTRLAVAGYTTGEKQAMRVFSSLPILKRYDVFSLETTDGICVIISGVINKDRTIANGFLSDVCRHFFYGFPSYWKEYAGRCMRNECYPPTVDVSEVNLPQSKTLGDEEARSNCCEVNLEPQGKMDAKGMQKNKETKSLAVPLPQNCDIANGGSEDISEMCCVASRSWERDSYAGGLTAEDKTNSNKPANDIDVSQKSNDGRRRNRSKDERMKKKSVKTNSFKSIIDTDTLSLKESHNGGKAVKRSISRLKIRKQHAESLDSDKVEAESNEGNPEGRNNHQSVSGLSESSYKLKLRKSDDSSVKDKSVQINEILNQDKHLQQVKGKEGVQTTNTRKSPLSAPSAHNDKENSVTGKQSSSENESISILKTRRKLAYETPRREEKKFPTSSQSSSFKRSRSGRLLMPSLEFWRNQRAIYNADRTITGIEGMDLDEP